MNHLRSGFRHELGELLPNLLIITASVPAAVLALSLLGWFDGVNTFSIWQVFYPAVSIVAMLLGAGSFSELHNAGRRIELLLRPVPAWTLVLVRAFSRTVLVTAMMAVTFSLASIVGAGLHALFATPDVAAFFARSIYRAEEWSDCGRWLFGGVFLSNAVFTFGSIYFRKSPLFRTPLLVAGWGMSYAIVAVVAVRTIFGRYIRDGRSIDITIRSQFDLLFPLLSRNHDLYISLAAIVAALGLYALATLRLRETEA